MAKYFAQMSRGKQQIREGKLEVIREKIKRNENLSSADEREAL